MQFIDKKNPLAVEPICIWIDAYKNAHFHVHACIIIHSFVNYLQSNRTRNKCVYLYIVNNEVQYMYIHTGANYNVT